METDFKKIEIAALKLDDKHRAELAKKLLISLEERIDKNIDQAWLKEINHRKEQLKSGNLETIPEEDVIKKARNKIKK